MSFCVSECISSFPRMLNATYDIKVRFLYKLAVNHHIKRIMILQPSIGEGFFFTISSLLQSFFNKISNSDCFFLLKRFQMYLEAECK